MECELFLSGLRGSSITFEAVTGDYIKACTNRGIISFVFLNAFIVIGRIPSGCTAEIQASANGSSHFIKLLTNGDHFSFAVGRTEKEAFHLQA